MITTSRLTTLALLLVISLSGCSSSASARSCSVVESKALPDSVAQFRVLSVSFDDNLHYRLRLSTNNYLQYVPAPIVDVRGSVSEGARLTLDIVDPTKLIDPGFCPSCAKTLLDTSPTGSAQLVAVFGPKDSQGLWLLKPGYSRRARASVPEYLRVAWSEDEELAWMMWGLETFSEPAWLITDRSSPVRAIPPDAPLGLVGQGTTPTAFDPGRKVVVTVVDAPGSAPTIAEYSGASGFTGERRIPVAGNVSGLSWHPASRSVIAALYAGTTVSFTRLSDMQVVAKMDWDKYVELGGGSDLWAMSADYRHIVALHGAKIMISTCAA